MRILGIFLIAVVMMATFARAALPDMARPSCSGTLLSAEVCQMPGLSASTAKPGAKPGATSCCAGLPDAARPDWRADGMAVRLVAGLARATLLPDRGGGAGPWRPPRG